MAGVFLGGRVEALVGQHGALLDLEADFQERREGVGEITNAECSDQTADVAEFGDSSCHDESERPVNGDHGDPNELASFGRECREIYYIVLEVMRRMNRK